MDCLICNLENPESARRCLCGYDFRTKTILVPRRFAALRFIAFVMRLAGWVVFLGGLALGAIFILNHYGYVITWPPEPPQLNGLPLQKSLGALAAGLLGVGAGELIAVFIATEYNTRLASRRLEALWRSAPRP